LGLILTEFLTDEQHAVLSAMKVCIGASILASLSADRSLQMESAVTAPVSGHIKRVVVHEGKPIGMARNHLPENMRQVTQSIKET
jgi:pyruvate carboxylase